MFGVSTKICQKIRHNCKNKIYVEGLRKCTSLKVFRHLFVIPRSTIGLISISDDTNLQNFIEIDRQQFYFIFQCRSYFMVRENIYFTLVPFDYDRNA